MRHVGEQDDKSLSFILKTPININNARVSLFP